MPVRSHNQCTNNNFCGCKIGSLKILSCTFPISTKATQYTFAPYPIPKSIVFLYIGTMAPYMFNACICCYTGCDPADFKILLKQHEEVLCLVHDCCLAVGDDGYGVGVDTNAAAVAAAKAGRSVGHCCILKALCCQLGLKFPEKLCSSASHCLCIKQGAALPFDNETVKEPLCAVCFIQLAPKVGILKEAPKLPSMVR